MQRIVLLSFMILVFVQNAFSQDALKILRDIDSNLDYGSVQYSVEMDIHNNGRTYVKKMNLWKKSNRYSYVEFTNPQDRGNKYLQIDRQVWLYSPDMEEILPLSQHMLRESMMGSDLSYEDLADSSTYESRYQVELTKGPYLYEQDTPFKNVEVVELSLQAKDRRYSYQKIVMQVDTKNNFPIQISYFSPSGALLKDTFVYEVINVDGIIFANRTITTDSFRNNSQTVVLLDSIEVNTEIPDSFFSRSKLR